MKGGHLWMVFSSIVFGAVEAFFDPSLLGVVLEAFILVLSMHVGRLIDPCTSLCNAAVSAYLPVRGLLGSACKTFNPGRQ